MFSKSSEKTSHETGLFVILRISLKYFEWKGVIESIKRISKPSLRQYGSKNDLPRVIGDRNITIDSDGKLTTNGDYPNQSSYIRISGPTITSATTEISSLKDLEAILSELTF